MTAFISDYELSQAEFPWQPNRDSERRSGSPTLAVASRSFNSLNPWQGFLHDAAQHSLIHLDNQIRRNVLPMNAILQPLEAAADEVDVRGALQFHLFPRINVLAERLGSRYKYKGGGSNRSFSFGDVLILDDSQAHPMLGPRHLLSNRIFGNGEVKGPWQWDIDADQTLEQVFQRLEQEKRKKITDAIQQLFGDMILDESKYGFLTNYNKTVFFRRPDGGDKGLEYSPVIRIDQAPIEKFLFVLFLSEQDKGLKHLYSRIRVKDTPPQGYTLRLPPYISWTKSGKPSKRQCLPLQVNARVRMSFQDLDDIRANMGFLNLNLDDVEFEDVPTYDMEYLGISGLVIAPGKYGNVVAGDANGVKLALKFFDLRFQEAASGLIKEYEAYDKLKAIQGKHIPVLLCVGRIPHTNILFLALTDEDNGDILRRLQSRRGIQVEKEIMAALAAIHELNVLHNDLKMSHIKWNGQPKLIDFELSKLDAQQELLEGEKNTMKALLADARREPVLHTSRVV